MTTSFAPTKIEVFRPSLGADEREVVEDVLASGWIGAGPRVAEFEQAFARHIGAPAGNVFSLTCATEALFQVCQWLADNRTGSEVVLPANAFIGAANAVIAAGLKPVLCDVDILTLNPLLSDIQRHVTDRTVAVIVQHFGGVPTQLDSIARWCHDNKITLMEDCACAVASRVLGIPAGTWGDFGIWSFDAMKVITCGDGGMLYCRDAGAADQIRLRTRLGMDVLAGQSAPNTERWWEFTATIPGRRSMMNDIGAAIGLAQLARLDELVNRRLEIWAAYQTSLTGLPWLGLPDDPPVEVKSSFYCYWVRCVRRDELAVHLRERGIYTTYRYWPVNRALGLESNTPNSDSAADHVLLLPLHAELTDLDVLTICDAVKEFGRAHA